MKTIYWMLFSLIFSLRLYGQDISATGSWSASVAGMLTEAGQNYPNAISSGSSQSLVSITGVNPSSSWSVLVHKQDLFWHGNLSIWVRKTGDGNCTGGGCAISPIGASPYLQLINSQQTLFTGVLGRTDVPIQYEIRGLSVLIPVNNYGASVVFTLIEI